MQPIILEASYNMPQSMQQHLSCGLRRLFYLTVARRTLTGYQASVQRRASMHDERAMQKIAALGKELVFHICRAAPHLPCPGDAVKG
jgi:hypothetical protein